MSGILDNKTRVIDTVITAEGRRQLARGGIDIQHVTFTDGTTFYSPDVLSGSQDATQRIYLEACQLPQDEITFQADEDGSLLSFKNAAGISTANGRIMSYAFTPMTQNRGSVPSQSVSLLRGVNFSSQSEALLASSADNFKRLYLLATHDKVFDDDKFAIGSRDITYVIHDDRPLAGTSEHTTHITSHDSLNTDPRLSHKQNFKYLPPVNKNSEGTLASQRASRTDHRTLKHLYLAHFPSLGRVQIIRLKYDQIMFELRHFQAQGYSSTINFDPTSTNNKLVGQFFERSGSTLRKLDVIDYGIHNTGNHASPTAHIFFVGKVEVDEKGTDTFIHLFTLVFE